MINPVSKQRQSPHHLHTVELCVALDHQGKLSLAILAG